MIYSRIGATLSRSSRHRNAINGASKGRTFNWNKEIPAAPSLSNLNGYIDRFDRKLGFLRGYLAAASANKRSDFNDSLSDLKFLGGSAGLNRFFSSKAPKKKNYENFYPKDKKEIPKKEEQKSGSKVDS